MYGLDGPAEGEDPPVPDDDSTSAETEWVTGEPEPW